MRQVHRLEPTLKTKPILTLQKRLETELLQLPLPELEIRIHEEIVDNPCLESEETVFDSIDAMQENELKQLEEIDRLRELGGDLPPIAVVPDYEEEELVPDYSPPPMNFWKRLETQLEAYFSNNEKLYAIAEKILDYVNGFGFLTHSVDEIAEELGVKSSEVDEVRKTIMYEWDPLGVASLDQKEFLITQLDYLGLKGTPAWEVVSEHFETLTRGGWDELKEKIGFTDEEMEKARRTIERLYPAPVEMYTTLEEPGYIKPEVYFRLVEDRIVVEIEESGIPRLRLNRVYLDKINDPKIDKKTRKFIEERVKRALDFIKALDSRRQNIRKVSELIAKYHEDFLKGKTHQLKPLTQKDAAEMLNIHVSTLNRVVKGRYAETPVGIFELRFFFQRGAGGSSSVSLDTLNQYIRDIIENEDPSSPLTDDDIRLILKRDYGVIISRRTVAMVRKKLGIPNSNKRRRLYTEPDG